MSDAIAAWLLAVFLFAALGALMVVNSTPAGHYGLMLFLGR